MPSRFVTAGILAFWLAMTGLLLQREVVPMMLAEVAPTFQIDLTDEIGSPLVGWGIFTDGKRVGTATSKINALEERRFEFLSTFRFDHPEGFHGLTTIETMDRITEDGKLQALAMKLYLKPHEIEIEGEVVAQKLKPRVFLNKTERKEFDLGEIDMTAQSNVVSSLKLVSRLRGLHVGQTWTETPFDPSRGIKNQLALDIFKQMKAPSTIATVKLDMLIWDRKEVVCHVIEYHDANKDVVARVWARKRDGLVLQREVSVLGRELKLVRVPH